MAGLLALEALLLECRVGAVVAPRASARTPVSTVAGQPISAGGGHPNDASGPRFVDIGLNLLDSMFDGEYRGKRVHPPDLDAVLARAAEAGVEHAIVTAGTLDESRRAINFVRSCRGSCPVQLHSTVGVHPTRCLEFLPQAARAELEAAMAHADESDDPAAQAELAATEADVLARPCVAEAVRHHVAALTEIIDAGAADGTVVAVGECGLDYDRLQFCSRAVQRLGFEAQLEVADACGLPLFLHNRNTGGDFSDVCALRRMRAGGVVHSFDGGSEELGRLLGLGLHIGLNGCSLKTSDNLAVASQVLCIYTCHAYTHAMHIHMLPQDVRQPRGGIAGAAARVAFGDGRAMVLDQTNARRAWPRAPRMLRDERGPMGRGEEGAMASGCSRQGPMRALPHRACATGLCMCMCMCIMRYKLAHVHVYVCHVVQVVNAARGGATGDEASVLAAEAEVAAAAYKNSVRLFQLEN